MATMAVNPTTARVFFHIEVTAEERDGHWAGTIEQMGTTVYADTFAELKDRVDEAAELLFSSFETLEDLNEYVNARGIAHTVNPAATRRFLTFSGEARVAIA